MRLDVEVFNKCRAIDSETCFYTLLAGLSVPHSREFGSVEGGVEVDWIPQLSPEERRIGFNG